MSRYSKETIAAKFEWEGSDAIEWFEATEVPEEIRETWALALTYREFYNSYLAQIYDWLDEADEV